MPMMLDSQFDSVKTRRLLRLHHFNARPAVISLRRREVPLKALGHEPTLYLFRFKNHIEKSTNEFPAGWEIHPRQNPPKE
jgi:hypothetical protein